MKTSKYLILLLLLTVAVPAAWAVPSEANFGKVEKTWTLNADGSQEYRCNSELTLYTHAAMNSTYGESFIIYDPQQQELIINSSYTKQKDGTIIKTPKNAFVECLPREAANAPAFNRLKEMVVVHTGLELGATIYLDYTIRSKAGYLPALDIDEFLIESSPVTKYSATIIVPEGKKLNAQLAGSNVKCSEQKANGTQIYRWTLSKVPAYSREAFQPANRNNEPQLIATTFASTKEALSYLKKQFSDSKSYGCRTNAEYVTEKAANVMQKRCMIHRFVVNSLGNSDITFPHAGFTVRDGEEVQSTAYGTEAEKTQMLANMLDAVNVKAEPIAVFAGNINTEAVGLRAMRHLLVRTEIDGKEKVISPLATGTTSANERGSLDKYYTLDGQEVTFETTPEEIEDSIPVKMDADKNENGYNIVTLPHSKSESWQTGSLNTQRSTLFEIPALCDMTAVYTIEPESGAQLLTSTDAIELTNAAGSLSRSLSEENGKVTVTCKLKVNKLQYASKDYSELRKLLAEWSDNAFRTLLFKVN